MKTSTVKKIETHARQTSAKLAQSIIRIQNDRQPDMTELMLNDIDAFGDSEKQTGPSGCFYRLTSGGDYFTTGEGRSKTVQLSFSAKKRLVVLTGGRVAKHKDANGKTKEDLIGGAFSDQDFRRCFDYIKSCGSWVTDDDGREFVIDTDDVNNAMRNGHRWDGLNRKPNTKKTTRSGSKSIKIQHYKDLPAIKNGKFSAPKKAEDYYTEVLKYIMTQCANGGISLDAKINGKQVLAVINKK
jgi:hypothetical protein